MFPLVLIFGGQAQKLGHNRETVVDEIGQVGSFRWKIGLSSLEEEVSFSPSLNTLNFHS